LSLFPSLFFFPHVYCDFSPSLLPHQSTHFSFLLPRWGIHFFPHLYRRHILLSPISIVLSHLYCVLSPFLLPHEDTHFASLLQHKDTHFFPHLYRYIIFLSPISIVFYHLYCSIFSHTTRNLGPSDTEFFDLFFCFSSAKSPTIWFYKFAFLDGCCSTVQGLLD